MTRWRMASEFFGPANVNMIAGNGEIMVKLKEAEVEHRVRARDFENWLDRTNKSPGEMIRKQRIRERLRK